MNQIGARVPEDTDAGVEGYADDNDLSKSEAIRELLARGLEYGDLQSENERLHRERRQILEQRDEHTDLVRAVEDRRTLERERAEAGLWTRFRWWVRGKPPSDDDAP